MAPLKLQALDPEDLKIISAHVQDAVLRVGDLAYTPRAKRMAMLMNRFDWASVGENLSDASKKYTRRRSALRVDRVLGARTLSIDLSATGSVLELLAIQFTENSPTGPDGYITFTFSGGGAIELHVECIECELRDLGPVWRTKSRPVHDAGKSAIEELDWDRSEQAKV